MLALPDDFAQLVKFDVDSGAVQSREGKRLEFKEAFNAADFSDYTKVLASFSNALGGAIIFGVTDKLRYIKGSDDPADEAKWTDRLREDFDPEISFTLKTFKIGPVKLFAVGVDPSRHKPVICKKNRSKVIVDKKGNKRDEEVIREGSIYFRYAGQTKVIGFSDLHMMLAEREQNYLKTMMETLQVIQKVGVENAGVVDMSAPASSVYMSAETAKGLNFIDKGVLVQEAGAPAYVVVGNVDVKQVVHAPLAEEDKNIPTEAAKQLSPVVRDVYGEGGISAQQLTQLLRYLKVDGDNRHCVFEKKLKRKYVTRAGIQLIGDFIRDNPDEALTAFGSKAANIRYTMQKKKQAADQNLFGAQEETVGSMVIKAP